MKNYNINLKCHIVWDNEELLKIKLKKKKKFLNHINWENALKFFCHSSDSNTVF